jgi:hypothetical protein
MVFDRAADRRPTDGGATSSNLEPDKFDWEAFRKCQEQALRRGHPPGLDFRRLKKQYVSTAQAQLRGCWAELRQMGKRFGLGRTEMLPIRTNEISAGANSTLAALSARGL